MKKLCIIAYCPWRRIGKWGECWYHSNFEQGTVGFVWDSLRWPFKFIYYLVRWQYVSFPPLHGYIKVLLGREYRKKHGLNVPSRIGGMRIALYGDD